MLYRILYILLLIATLTMAACVNTSSLYQDFIGEFEQEVPNEWVGELVSGSLENNWIEQFDDPQLAAIVKEGITNNSAIARSAATVIVSYQQANLTAGGSLPEISFGANARRTVTNAQASNTGSVVYSSMFDLTLQMTWNIDFWGSLSSNEKAAIYRYQAAFADYQRSINQKVSAIARNWYQLQAEQQLHLLDQQKAATGQTLLAEAESSYQLGLRTIYETYNQRARVLSLLGQEIRRKNSLRQIRRNLEVLLGRYPRATITADQQLPLVNTSIPAGLPSEVLKRRADLIAAEARLKASYEDIAAARANRFPSLRLTASMGRSSSELSELNNNGLSIFNLAGSVTLPLFAFGTLKAREQLAEAQAQQLQAGYREAVRQAFLEVENTLDNEHLLREQIALATQASEQYGKAAETAARDYQNGVGDLGSWSNAELADYDATASLIALQRDLILNRINLHLALGGNFSDLATEQLEDLQK